MHRLIPLFVFLIVPSFLGAQDRKPSARFEIRVLIVELGPEKMPEFDTTQDRKQIESILVGPARDLVDKLKEQGIELARRTVAKYRKILDIPTARQRKTF